MNSVILRNIGSNWIGMTLHILVAFFMMPFVLKELGTVSYGFWAFIQSLISFMFILDFGIRSSMTRYLAKYFAEENHLEANRVFNVGLSSYSVVCIVVIAFSMILGVYLPSFFHVHVDAQTVFLTVLFVGISVGLSFPAAVFNGILTGHQRYDLMNIAKIAALCLRTVLIIAWLQFGYGLTAIAVATLLGSIVLLLLNVVFSINVYPYLNFKIFEWDWGTAKVLGNHGFFSFIAIGSMRILTDSGIVLVGLFLGPSAVTLYAIAVSLTTYANQLVGGITTTLTPAASALEAKRNWNELAELCLSSAKLIIITGYSILITFIMTGDVFISLWLGAEYKISYEPLILLSICWGFYYLQNSVFVILIGISKHRIPAFLMLGQAVLSIGLGIFLVQSDGINGVAWGALIASALVNVISLLYGLHVLGISVHAFFTKALMPAIFALVPFCLSLTACRHFFYAENFIEYFGQITFSIFIMAAFLPWLGLTSLEWERIMRLAYSGMESVSYLVPKNVKRFVKEGFNTYLFNRTVQRLKGNSPGILPNRQDLQELSTRWGNEGYTASIELLEEVVRKASSTTGPILECGGGLSTIVMGIVVGGRDIKIWTLEHNEEWYQKVGKVLKRNKINSVEICYAPLHDYGAFTWYQPPWNQIPSGFQLVVCDGPPGGVPGGRYGMVPLTKSKLDKNATIILDDAQRPMEAETAQRWAIEIGKKLEIREHVKRSFAILSSQEDYP